jgi:uncharacterized RDD family membrane protein YckC
MGEERKRLYLASWGERLVAWLIDVILVGGISTILLLYVGRLIPLAWWERPQIFWFPRRMASPPYPPLFLLVPFVLFTPWFTGIGVAALLLIYWTLCEGLGGQSLGKRVMGLRVVDLGGGEAGISRALVESLGKAFLLPLDLVIGLIIPEGVERRQRLFNYLSSTIVIRIRERAPPHQVEYVKA